MSEKKKLTVAEILAAARAAKQDSASTPSAAPEGSAASDAEAIPAKPAAAKPASTGPAATGEGARPSVADILAAARAAKAGAPADKPVAAAAKPAAPKPAAKPAAEKPAAEKTPAEKPAKAGAAAAKDTSSILAAARSSAKPGPMTKAEAAAQGSPAVATKARPAAPPMPAKPDYARPKSSAVDEDRRTFLAVMFGTAFGGGMAALSATITLWTLGTARFMFPNVLTEPPSRFKVGFPSDFPPGSVDEKFKAQFGVWVVSTEYRGLRQIVALRTVCTHLGCTPNWLDGEQKFKCPCHGSGFYKDGINFEGPAPRPLERYAIRLSDDGQLEVDKSKMFQEELGQWEDGASFVPV